MTEDDVKVEVAYMKSALVDIMTQASRGWVRAMELRVDLRRVREERDRYKRLWQITDRRLSIVVLMVAVESAVLVLLGLYNLLVR